DRSVSPNPERLFLARHSVRRSVCRNLYRPWRGPAHGGLQPASRHRASGLDFHRTKPVLLYSGSRRIIRANWAIAVTSWYTVPAKNGQNTSSQTMLYNCNSMAAMPKVRTEEKQIA